MFNNRDGGIDECVEGAGDAPAEPPALGRRHLLRYGGIAAAGAVAAAAVSAAPAGATTANMQYGTTNAAGTDETELTSSAPHTLVVDNTQDSIAILATSSGQGLAIQGKSTAGTGLAATSDTGTALEVSTALLGDGSQVTSDAAAIIQGGSGNGVSVFTLGAGDAVFAQALGTGKGIEVVANSGTGITVESHSGVALIASNSVASNLPTITAASAGTGGVLVAFGSAAATSPTVQSASQTVQPAVAATGKVVPAGGAVALAGNGAALAVHGAASFTRSGVITIPATKTNVVVNVPGGLAASSHVLATMQTTTAAAIGVKSATPSAATGKITITLTAAAPAGGISVAWFVFG